MPRSSTSKIKVAFGGMTPAAPALPYAQSDVMVSFERSPRLISLTPSSQPLMTAPTSMGGSERRRRERLDELLLLLLQRTHQRRERTNANDEAEGLAFAARRVEHRAILKGTSVVNRDVVSDGREGLAVAS